MSVTAPISAMRDWIALVLPSAVPVIYDSDPEPTAPRPNVASATSSYCAIGFLDDESDMSMAAEVTSDTAGVDPTLVNQYRTETVESTLGVELYGAGAVDYAHTLRLSYSRADVLALLVAAGDISIKRVSRVSREPVLRSATREPGASLTFAVEWIESEIYEIEGVDEIVTEVEVDDD